MWSCKVLFQHWTVVVDEHWLVETARQSWLQFFGMTQNAFWGKTHLKRHETSSSLSCHTTKCRLEIFSSLPKHELCACAVCMHVNIWRFCHSDMSYHVHRFMCSELHYFHSIFYLHGKQSIRIDRQCVGRKSYIISVSHFNLLSVSCSVFVFAVWRMLNDCKLLWFKVFSRRFLRDTQKCDFKAFASNEIVHAIIRFKQTPELSHLLELCGILRVGFSHFVRSFQIPSNNARLLFFLFHLNDARTVLCW